MGSLEQYEILKAIGKGSYGSVYLVRSKEDKKQYVLKKVKLEGTSQKERVAAEREVKMLAKLRHPNIVDYRSSFYDKRGNILCIVMQHCEGGDLFNKLKEKRGKYIREDQILEWFGQLVSALEYVHSQKILHRDLKTQNIFLTGGTLQLGDFGIARSLDCTMAMARTVIGTPYYMSPELFENKPYNYKSDVWALGCVLYEITTLKHAFDARDMTGLAMKIIKGKYPPISSTYSSGLATLIKGMLSKNPESRPSMAQVAKMPLVRARIPGAVECIPASVVPVPTNRQDNPLQVRGPAPGVSKVPGQPQAKVVGADSRAHAQAGIARRAPAPHRRVVPVGNHIMKQKQARKEVDKRSEELQRAQQEKQRMEAALSRLEKERESRLKYALQRQQVKHQKEKEMREKQLKEALELNRQRQMERMKMEHMHKERMARIEREASEKRERERRAIAERKAREKEERDREEVAKRERGRLAEEREQRRRAALAEKRKEDLQAQARHRREEKIMEEKERLRAQYAKWEDRVSELEEHKKQKEMEVEARRERQREKERALKKKEEEERIEKYRKVREEGKAAASTKSGRSSSHASIKSDKEIRAEEYFAEIQQENQKKLEEIQVWRAANKPVEESPPRDSDGGGGIIHKMIDMDIEEFVVHSTPRVPSPEHESYGECTPEKADYVLESRPKLERTSSTEDVIPTPRDSFEMGKPVIHRRRADSSNKEKAHAASNANANNGEGVELMRSRLPPAAYGSSDIDEIPRKESDSRNYGELSNYPHAASESPPERSRSIPDPYAADEPDGSVSARDRMMMRKQQRKDQERLDRERELKEARVNYHSERVAARDREFNQYHSVSAPNSRPQSARSRSQVDSVTTDGDDVLDEEEEIMIGQYEEDLQRQTLRVEELQAVLEQTRQRELENEEKSAPDEPCLSGIEDSANGDEDSDPDLVDSSDDYEGEEPSDIDVQEIDLLNQGRLEDRINSIRRLCEECLGKELFHKAYSYVNKCSNNAFIDDEEEVKARHGFVRLAGEENIEFMDIIGRLIFMESAYYANM